MNLILKQNHRHVRNTELPIKMSKAIYLVVILHLEKQNESILNKSSILANCLTSDIKLSEKISIANILVRNFTFVKDNEECITQWKMYKDDHDEPS